MRPSIQLNETYCRAKRDLVSLAYLSPDIGRERDLLHPKTQQGYYSRRGSHTVAEDLGSAAKISGFGVWGLRVVFSLGFRV
jgi:hypothetical protein